MTEQSAKLQHLGRGSQGKEGREVRIYTIKNGVKHLTVGSGQKAVVSLW